MLLMLMLVTVVVKVVYQDSSEYFEDGSKCWVENRDNPATWVYVLKIVVEVEGRKL
jgi:hypothetical protein